MNFRFCMLWLASPALLPAELVIAQESQPEELVVSAYRAVNANELDTSITLLDAETIESVNAEHFQELVKLVPNMSFSGEGSRARYYQIRGVGEREQYEGAPNPSVGFIVDDIDLSGVGGVTSSWDLRQAEVLRGPQSARYGSSALAGIVYVQSAVPDDELSADIEVTGGSEDTYAAGLAVGGPLTDTLKGRVSWHRYTDNGFRKNSFLDEDDTNERDETTVRGKLSWEIGEWTALLSGLYADFDNGYDAWTVRNNDITWSNQPGDDSQETKAGSLKLSGPLGPVELVSISSIASSDIRFSYDGDWGNEDFWQDYGNYEYEYFYDNPRDRDTYSQELRLVSTEDSQLFNGSTDWVLGAYWQHLEEDNEITSTGIYSDVGEEDFCVPFCATDRRIASDYDADKLAVFGSLDAALTEQWGLSLGLRFERWDASYADTWTDINYAGPPDNKTCNVSGIDCDPDENMIGGHVALSYDWTADLRSYARVARGFKAGGFNPSLAALQGDGAALGEEFLAYDPEYLWNYELGLKSVWLDGSLTGDLVAFYMDRDDAQLSQSSQQVEFDPNSFVFVTYNGDADVFGLEATGAWQVVENWQLHGAVGWMDSEIKSTGATEQVSPGAANRALAHAPSYTANFGVSYRNSQGWHGRVDVNAVDEFYFDISNNEKSDSYQTVNARVARDWEQLSVSLWGKNIFDEDFATRGFYFGNEPGDFAPTLYTRFGDPRTYGVTLSYSY